MIAFAVILSIVLYPAVWLFGYCNLDHEAMGITREEAERRFCHNLVRHKGFWVWLAWCAILYLIFSGTATKMIDSVHGG